MVVNLDPGNDMLPYDCAVDVMDLVKLEEVMDELELGPNGGLVYCMEYIEQNLDWLQEKLATECKDKYILFDLPGQVELFTHHGSVRAPAAPLPASVCLAVFAATHPLPPHPMRPSCGLCPCRATPLSAPAASPPAPRSPARAAPAPLACCSIRGTAAGPRHQRSNRLVGLAAVRGAPCRRAPLQRLLQVHFHCSRFPRRHDDARFGG